MLLDGQQKGHPACKKPKWWDAGMVKSRLVLPSWYRLIRIVPDTVQGAVKW